MSATLESTAPSSFVHELAAYELLTRAGLHPPRHGVVGGFLPFTAGEPTVLKGIAEELWHKSELGCVRFLPFEPERLRQEAGAMMERTAAEGLAWIDGLVCERVQIERNRDLPSEAFASLSRTEAGWVILCGFGGLQANALAELAPPCRWPVDVVTPEQALAEFSSHLLGRTWLGKLRATHPLTTKEDLQTFFDSLWQLAALCEAEGLSLLELNPIALDPAGQPRPLDAVGKRAQAGASRVAPPEGFLEALRAPQRIAIAGVSSQAGGVGRTILENLQRYALPAGDLLLIKRGAPEFPGLPCIADVAPLREAPVDLLIVSLPAPAAAEMLTALIAQGGGARCVALVAGGIGDGADSAGLGKKLQQLLRETRAAGRWTPAILGPNFLGHWSPARDLDTSFIPTDKLAAPATTGGELTLLSQSGAFLLCRRSRQPALRFRLGIALGNQMDVAMADVLASLAEQEKPGPVACYVEGFGAGHLAAFAKSARTLTARGARVLLHRAGRTEAGQAAAASHTGAMAGNLELERALLERCGVKFSGTIAEFDAALTWLAAYPHLRKGPVALLSNAGFESVNGSDLFSSDLPAAQLSPAATENLAITLTQHKLGGLVAPRLPLDLTPMAEEPAYLAAADVLLRDCAVLVVGLVPFTRKLGTSGESAKAFAAQPADLAQKHGKPVAVAVDSGADYEEYRAAFTAAGLATFDRIETALLGLKLI
jgi:acyl-CoA synthetase (NDP forming)